MSETNELFNDVHYIKNKVETLEKIELLRMRSDQELKSKYIEILKKDPAVLSVYKCIDGHKGQREIAQELGLNDMRVSRVITKLEQEGLVEFSHMNSKFKVFIHTVVERAYNFCKIL